MRKTYRKKTTAKRAAKRKFTTPAKIYKVKHGWRITRVKRRR